jgi:hypothetical protein
MVVSKRTWLILVLLAGIGCAKQSPKILPAQLTQLTGVWTTDAERYKDRFLELSAAFVIIGARGQAVPSVQAIKKVESQLSGERTVFTIDSSDLEGNQYQMTFEFNPANGGELRIKNPQQIVWKRRPEDNEI